MRSVSYRLADLNHVTVPLGFRGENEHTRVIIDCKKAFDEYPDAIPSLAVSPPNGAAYPAVIVRDGDLVYWDVRDSDLAKEGRGTAQLTFTEDGVVRKDDIFKTVIGKSILPAGPAPDPIADWITEANRAIGTIEGAMETAQEAAEEASGSATAAAGSAADAADQATAAAESAEAARSAAGEAAQKADDAAESARASASSATAAAGSANSAAGSATQAAGLAEAAAGSAVEAGTSAAAAAGSATAAAESATNASEAEANASEHATAAAASEANAADSATAAATSETNAANSETNAAASATAAAGSASDAADSATAASGSATAAEGSATAAAASAASAASAAEALIDDTSTATNKTWSAKKISTVVDALQKNKAPVIIDHAEGNPIVLTDGADGLPIEGMKIHLLPKQDLHGYDSPWPGGGGKNLLPTVLDTIKTINTNGTWSGNIYTHNGITYTVNIDNDGNITGVTANGTASGDSEFYIVSQYVFQTGSYVLNGCPSGGSTNTYRIFATNFGSDTGSGLPFTTDGTIKTTIRIQIKSGTQVSNQVYKPMVRLSSVSDATFAPYSNICPISGWSGLAMRRTGKNLLKLDESAMVSKGWNRIFPVSLKAGTYIISCQNQFGASTKGASVNLTDENDTTIIVALTSGYTFGDSVFLGSTVNITEDQANKIKNIRFALRASGATYNDITQGDIQLELGETASPYTPYTGDSYPVTFPDGQTIYGVTLDAVNGVLMVDRALVDLGTLSPWYKISTVSPHWRFWTYLNTAKAYGTLLSSDYVQITASAQYQGAEGVATQTSGDNVLVMVSDERYEEVNTFASAMSGVQLVYELATPIEIHIDPISIQTLLGDNTIWSDANGTIELDYRADTKLFIAKNKQDIRATIAPIEDGTTASQAYSAGKLFYHDGNLCKAKTSIASGATFTLNTNYEITTVADELFALN